MPLDFTSFYCWDGYVSEKPLEAEVANSYTKDANGVITTKDSIQLLKDVFGGNRFKEYVGQLTFFHRLPLMMAKERNGRACAELVGSGSPYKITALSGGSSRVSPDPYDWEETEAAKGLRADALVQQLMLTANSDVDPGHYTRQPTTWDQALHLKSASFGVELLREIGSVYTNLMRAVLWYNRRAVDTCNVDVRMYNIPILVEEVEELREKLLLVRSDSERRALEEDITGKIILVCWCGVRLEIEQVLEKVVDRFVDKMLTKEEQTVRAM